LFVLRKDGCERGLSFSRTYVAEEFKQSISRYQSEIEIYIPQWSFIRLFTTELSSTRLEKFQEEIYESAIKNELEGVRRSPDILSSLNYKDSMSLLALLAQKLGSKISKEIYHDFLSKRDSLTTSYYTFDAMANIVPTEGISFLTHLETIIDLTEKVR
jgi:hypothetical protein